MKQRVTRHDVTQPQDQSYRLIPLTQGQNAIVDAADFDWLSQWNWCAAWRPVQRKFYATAWQAGEMIKMHRLILRCREGEMGDHKNGNPLDNQRTNLRKCTNAQNARNKIANNKHGYKGISLMGGGRKNPWLAHLTCNYEHIYVGYFGTKEEAARAYDAAAVLHFGEFAKLNFS
jgi:AP2 domain